MTEESLMAAYCAGDRLAFEKLYARLGPKLHGFFMRSFNNGAVADDLLQTTLLKVHRARGDFRRDRAVRPWVFAIAARVRLDEYRKRRKLAEALDEESLARLEENGEAVAKRGAETVETVEAIERADRVRHALQALPDSQRSIVHLHRFEGMSFAEIATVLDTTEGAVKLRAFRAYERLRKELRPLLAREAP